MKIEFSVCKDHEKKSQKIDSLFSTHPLLPAVCCMCFVLGVVCTITHICIHTFLERPEGHVSDFPLSLPTFIVCPRVSLSLKLIDSVRLTGQGTQGLAFLM